MRALSYILIALGLYLLGHAVYDETCGRTHMPVRLLRRHFNSGYLYSIPVLKGNNPELFRKFMTTHWIYAGLIAGVGCALYLTSDQPDTPEATEKPDSESTLDD